MSHARQRFQSFMKSKTSDKQQNEAEVSTTSTEPNYTASSNNSGESSDEMDEGFATFASSFNSCNSSATPVASIPVASDSSSCESETQLSSVKWNSSNASKSNASFEDKSIQRVPGQKGKRKCVICTVCLPNPAIVKRSCYKGRVPPICQPGGTEAREQTIQEDLQSLAHQQCLKAERLKKLSTVGEKTVEKSKKTVPLVKMFNSQHQQLANKIGSLILHVHNDAKCLTSSAFSWPSRVIAAKMAHELDYDKPFKSYSPSDFDLQYIRPPVVQERLRTIVSADLPRIKKEIDSCIAVSFWCDASMGETQKDHEYMLLNMIKNDGKRDLKFIGILGM